MSNFNFKLNSKGVRDMLRSEEVKAMLRERAEAIKGRAGDGYEVSTFTGKTRANASVKATTVKAIKDTKKKLDCKVVMERSSKMPDRFVLIEQTGSGKRKHLKSSTIVFQSYDSTLYKAAQLNEAVKAAVEMLVELDDVSSVSLNSDYIYTDTESKKYRYQAVFDIKHY